MCFDKESVFTYRGFPMYNMVLWLHVQHTNSRRI